LLGRALVDDTSTTGRRLSKWTLAQRRSAIRSFANLMRPELLALLEEEPAPVVDRALRLVAERIGGGYRLTGGAPRRRGGYAPNSEDINAVLLSLGNAPGFTGLRNRAFFAILASTGCRVNALLRLDGTECLLLPNGRLRLYLHEKGKGERREVELSRNAVQDLYDYMAALNQIGANRLRGTRVQIGEPGTVWRNARGDRWGYGAVLEALKDGCLKTGVPAFTPHALRRSFATDAASRLPRHVVAQAGGWRGLDRLDDHYVQAREPTIWDKMNGSSKHVATAQSKERLIDDAAAVFV
jgi:integrase